MEWGCGKIARLYGQTAASLFSGSYSNQSNIHQKSSCSSGKEIRIHLNIYIYSLCSHTCCSSLQAAWKSVFQYIRSACSGVEVNTSHSSCPCDLAFYIHGIRLLRFTASSTNILSQKPRAEPFNASEVTCHYPLHHQRHCTVGFWCSDQERRLESRT